MDVKDLLNRFYEYLLPKTGLLFSQTLPCILTDALTLSHTSSILPMDRVAYAPPFWDHHWSQHFYRLFNPSPHFCAQPFIASLEGPRELSGPN